MITNTSIAFMFMFVTIAIMFMFITFMFVATIFLMIHKVIPSFIV
ncbi:hypothetical protein SD77_1126 [Bacillus badius]|uniref:Uncharacterized protein n=1 Tax=Bacillus badius TaxID=1455 RepID=A0ABR5ASR6_BACBA|nr:hypothetical protein SD78_2734 [Bacillus badius]KIL77797.1 hypothetical protein SD77_1126 [Bacillus badius]